ncbi:MAG: carboxypeptidase regulatory-like domain-containing protein [Acidobacteria bacterium]|nr:carboxypeptidase regulatory-like domain-containing protein [Acidobacteriota bacterium]
MRQTARLVLVCLCLLGVRMSGQGAVSPASEHSILSGDVMTVAGGALTPLPRAIVRLEGVDSPVRLSAISGADGAFTLAAVPPGRYLLSAGSPAYVTTYYGAQRFNQAGAVIVVTPGENIADLRITLQRGGVIAGTARTESGRAVRGVYVWVQRSGSPAAPGFLNDRPGLQSAGPLRATTNAEGRFRLFGLPPGRYLVSMPAGTFEAAHIFYPGTFFPDEATPIDIGPGEVREDLDITLTRPKGQRVSGRLIGEGIAGADVRIAPVGPVRGSRSASADGRFTFENVPPGRYVISGSAVVAGPDGIERYSGQTPVVVGAFELQDVQVPMGTSAGVRVAGRVQTAERGVPLPPARVTLRPQEPWQSDHPLEAAMRTDGAFAIESVPPGRYRVEVALDGVSREAPWRAASFMVGGEDVLDGELTVDANGVDAAVLTVTQSTQELRGTLRGSASLPSTALTMFVYPADRRFWTRGSRRIQIVRPATDGSFVFRDLPPGEYFAISLFDPDPVSVFDPVYLASLVDASLRVSLSPGERGVLDVQVAGP